MNSIGHVSYSVGHGTYQKAIGEPLACEPHKVVSSGEGIGVQQELVSNRSGRYFVAARLVSVIDVGDRLNIEVHPDERG